MQQGTLPFHYAEENESTGMTALSGLPAYLDLAAVARLGESVRRHVGVREGTQGWTDAQMVTALVMLNLAGGESVDDLRLLEKDEGLGRVLFAGESHGMRRAERRAQLKRWRKERRRVVASPTAVFRYLDRFHDESEETRRRPGRAFIPAANDALRGLRRVNADLVGFAGGHAGHTQATLDMDATLIGTHKRQANYCYKKCKAYQPLTTYWHEADLVVHSEFRDGNGLPRTGYGVPAGYEQLRVLKESLEQLPAGVSKVMMRSDSAGYQKELLKYCAEGRDERFGVIEFCVGVDVMPEFKEAVSEVEEDGWYDLYRTEGEHRELTRQQYAEVCYVTDWTGYSRNSPDYRFIAIREPLRNPPLFDMDVEKLSVPTMQMGDGGWYKVTGVVTNRDLPGDELIRWYRQRCGKGEEVHSVLKEDLAGGRLPSGKFGANAAWWAIVVLAFNLNSAMKRLVLGGEWVSRRLKAVRFGVICIAGRVVRHARRLIIRLARGHPTYDVLVSARRRINALATTPLRA